AARTVHRKTRTHLRRITLAFGCASVCLCAPMRADEDAELRAALRRALGLGETNAPIFPTNALPRTDVSIPTNAIASQKTYQRTSLGVPPASPERFDPDAGIRYPTSYYRETNGGFGLQWRTNAEPAIIAPIFNPDPGAALK